MSLVFKRKKGQSVRIGDCQVTVAEVSRSEVKLVIEAPPDIVVVRSEVGSPVRARKKTVAVEYRRPPEETPLSEKK